MTPGIRGKQVTDLLLQGCDNAEIAKELGITERTVKKHLNQLFVRFNITDGIKRVKLATMIYRSKLWSQNQQSQMQKNIQSSDLSAKEEKTKRSQEYLEQPSM